MKRSYFVDGRRVIRHTLIRFRFSKIGDSGGGGDCGRFFFIENVLVQHRIYHADAKYTNCSTLRGNTQLHQIHACAHIATASVFVEADTEYGEKTGHPCIKRNSGNYYYYYYCHQTPRKETKSNKLIHLIIIVNCFVHARSVQLYMPIEILSASLVGVTAPNVLATLYSFSAWKMVCKCAGRVLRFENCIMQIAESIQLIAN